MSEGMSAEKFKAQDRRYESLGRNDNQVIKSRVNSINENYAKKLLMEAEAIPESRDFIEKILNDSLVDGEFSEESFYKLLTDAGHEDEIKLPSFRELDIAVVGKMLLTSKEEREKAN